MTKKSKRRSAQSPERKTNWLVLGGILGIGVVGLFALLFYSLQGPGAPTPVPTPAPSFVLEEYCDANPENCIVTGAADAPITVVEVSDYGCGHCANFNLQSADTLKAQYVNSGQVRWITLPYALGGQTGFPTLPSASAAFCANEQGVFEPYHKALYGLQSTADFNKRDGFLNLAESLRLDTEAFAACLDDGRYEANIRANIQAANNSGINSTPSFYINGELVRGNLPLANFQQLIDAALAS
jgi:protein-disulfide isomerase